MCNITLKKLREQNNKTVAEVAEVLGVAISTLYNYENGTRKIRLEHVLLLSVLYDCMTDEIIEAQFNSCQKDR